jgi:hypothetical protein
MAFHDFEHGVFGTVQLSGVTPRAGKAALLQKEK